MHLVHCNSSFANKKIVITGGSRGFGKALSTELINRGGRVMTSDRRTFDVTHSFQMEQLARLAEDRFGKIDIWINNAGCSAHDEDDPALIKNVVNTNLIGTVNGTNAAINHHVPLIVNVVGAGHNGIITGTNKHTVYASTKCAVDMYSRAIDEFNPHFRVVRLNPGLVKTSLLHNQIYSQSVPKLNKQILDLLSVEPEIAASVAADLIASTPHQFSLYDCFIINVYRKIIQNTKKRVKAMQSGLNLNFISGKFISDKSKSGK
ncbi:putative SDR family oxidoreductase [Tetraselmis virus 1]|uniref:Putative SDR family oxidoreductase n=1 Tax=Tetraselmis virus 1 TaxID=2060617 RepID=A0A2P0VP75_9VIRU|nr:putative SDR family oxidoreductase [Tetraselmis virus 1]AUF82708.1 putative SDR family oxidoreductase [Tetraselmis virus 1]